MSIKTKSVLYLILIALLDTIIPIPFAALGLIYVLLEKPVWFRTWVDDIYRA